MASGHAVQAAADRGDPARRRRGRAGPPRRRPARRNSCDGISAARSARSARTDSPGTGNTHSNGQQQPGPAGGQHHQPRAAGQQALEQHHHAVEQVLAVVQDQQRLAGRPASRGACPRPTRPGCSPRPSASATAGAIIAGSVTGTRSTYQTPSANRSATSAATASASRVLPTPPGPTAVTRRCVGAAAAASAARSAARPTNGVSGDGQRQRPRAARPRAAGSDRAARRRARRGARRSPTRSLRSSEDTWLSTVRTEMNSRAAISALVRCSPTAASTSASRSDTPASAVPLRPTTAILPAGTDSPVEGFPSSPAQRVVLVERLRHELDSTSAGAAEKLDCHITSTGPTRRTDGRAPSARTAPLDRRRTREIRPHRRDRGRGARDLGRRPQLAGPAPARPGHHRRGGRRRQGARPRPAAGAPGRPGHPLRPAARPDRQGRLHRAELPRPRRRDRRRAAARADHLPQGPRHRRRARRHRARPARVDEDRLGGRARRSSSAAPRRYLDSPAEARGVHRRLRDRQRRLRARVPARARRAVGQGQELRDVQPARARGWSPPTRSPTRRPRPAAVGQRRAASRTAAPPT